MKPDFSFIIPAYQEEKLIGSILNILNGFKNKYNYEVIVSDGGSEDNTVKIANDLADKVTVHQADYRQTISEGRNKGSEIAESDHFVFINADTRPADAKVFFEKINEWAKDQGKYQKYDAIACYVDAFPEERKFKDQFYYGFFNWYFALLNKIGIGMGRGECQLVKKQAFTKLGGYDPTIVAGEDFDLFRRISKVGKVSFANDIVIFESPRRFRKQGYLFTIIRWFSNSVFVMFFGKSLSNEWESVR